MLSGATAEPVGLRILPFLALAGVMDKVELGRLDRVNASFFRRRFPPDIAEPIIAGGFWSRGGAAALRAVAGERFAPRLAAYPGPTLILNGEYDLPFRLFAGSFAAVARDARRVRSARRVAPRQSRPPRGLHRGRPPVHGVAARLNGWGRPDPDRPSPDTPAILARPPTPGFP